MPRIPLPISGGDLAELRESTLTDLTILMNGIYTESDPVKMADILNRIRKGTLHKCQEWQLGPDFCQQGGLVYPYHDLEGKLTGFVRVKPRSPRSKDGKPVKYEQPLGEPCRAYYPRESTAKLRDGKSDIFVPEGEKKALALSQLGLAVVGLGGVWCWKKKGTDELLEDLAAIPLTGRKVYITFDYDESETTRRDVQLAAKRFARTLRKAGVAEVYLVELPPGRQGAKQGVDDFLKAHGADAFNDLVNQAKPVPAILGYKALTHIEGRTDTANGLRLPSKYEQEVRWVGSWDKYLIWDGTRWRIDAVRAIDLRAKGVAGDCFREAEVASLERLAEIAKIAQPSKEESE
jgi:hypothetical protein